MSTTRFPASQKWTVYVTPKSTNGWHKTIFAALASKTQLLSKEVCYKVSLCKNVQRQHCSYIIPLPKGPQMDWGRRPIYLKFALKVIHHFIKRRFRQISLNSASAVRANKKVQLPLIWSRKCAFQSSTDKPCVLPQVPQRVVQNENFNIWRCLSYLRCRWS